MTHICISKLTTIGLDNGQFLGRRQAIIWTNGGISLFGTWGLNCNEIFIKTQQVAFKEVRLKMSSGKWRPFCLGLNVLMDRTKQQYLNFTFQASRQIVCNYYNRLRQKLVIYTMQHYSPSSTVTCSSSIAYISSKHKCILHNISVTIQLFDT